MESEQQNPRLRSERVEARLRPREKDEIEQAAEVEAISLSDFVRAALTTAARRTLRKKAA